MGNFVIMNEKSVNTVDYMRLGIYTFVLKGIFPNIHEINE